MEAPVRNRQSVAGVGRERTLDRSEHAPHSKPQGERLLLDWTVRARHTLQVGQLLLRRARPEGSSTARQSTGGMQP